MHKGPERIRSFDIAKGISMLCIIAGHLSVPEVNAIVFTFHVPLFFLVSGCFYRVPSSPMEALKKRASRLLAPYVTCAVLCSMGKGIRLALMNGVSKSWKAVAGSFVSALYGSGSPKDPSGDISSFGAIWFLLALFWALTMYDAICDKRWRTLAAIALFAIGVATRSWWLPLSIQPGMCAVLFLHIGHVARERFPESLGRGKVPLPLAICALTIWAVGFYCSDKHMSMVRCYFPCVPLDLVRALSGSLVVLWLSGLIERVPLLSDGLEAYGRNTLTVLCFHMFDLRVIPWKALGNALGLVGGTWDEWGRKALIFGFKVSWSVLGVVVVGAIRRMSSSTLAQPATQKPRIRPYDIAKGIAILLVVAAHQESMDPLFRRLVFSFHMPFFFLANALFVDKDYDVRRTFIRSLRTLALPYAAVCLLQVLLKGMLTPEHTKLAMLHRLQTAVTGMSFSGVLFPDWRSVSLIWFVACLFVARNVYALCRRAALKAPRSVQYAAPLVLCLVGWWLGTQRWYLPWSADVALFAQVFMLVGDEARRSGLLERRPSVSAVVFAVAAWVTLATGGFQIEMATRSYRGGLACIVGACAGSIIVLWVAEYLDRAGSLVAGGVADHLAKVLMWLGRNSMVMLAIHCLRRQWANWSSGIKSFSSTYDWVGNACIEILFCIAVCFVYQRAKARLRAMRAGVC